MTAAGYVAAVRGGSARAVDYRGGTTPAASSASSASSAGGAAAERLVRDQVRLLGTLLVADLVAQRVALPAPGGQVPLLLALGIAGAFLGVRRGLLEVDRGHLALGGVTVLAFACCTAASTLITAGASIPSLAYLLFTYVPLLTVVTGSGAYEVVYRLARLLVRVCIVLAVLSVAQFAVQFVGYSAPDPLSSIIPSPFLLSGYNTISPVGYQATLYRCNGFLFLEPSFCSQFLGLAVLAAAWTHEQRRWPFVVLLLGIATTVAGTGVVLMGAGLIALVASGRRDILLRMAPAVVVGILAIAVTPVGGLFVGRATEGASKDTSTGERFVIPVQLLGGGWLHKTATALVGYGPGQANRFIVRTLGVDSGVVPLAPLKLIYEYGALGAVPFAVFLAWVMLRGVVAPPLAAGLIVGFLALSGSLQQASTVLPMWLLVAVAPRRPGVTASG